MNPKVQIALAAVVLSVTLAGAAFTLGTHRASAAASVSHSNCSNPAPNEVCPSDGFLVDFQNWKALKVQIDEYQKTAEAKRQQALVDQFNGMTTRLRDEVNQVGVPTAPAGSFDWVEDKGRFVLKPPAKPATPATPEAKAK
jgi:hypothetical protein